MTKRLHCKTPKYGHMALALFGIIGQVKNWFGLKLDLKPSLFSLSRFVRGLIWGFFWISCQQLVLLSSSLLSCWQLIKKKPLMRPHTKLHWLERLGLSFECQKLKSNSNWHLYCSNSFALTQLLALGWSWTPCWLSGHSSQHANESLKAKNWLKLETPLARFYLIGVSSAQKAAF